VRPPTTAPPWITARPASVAALALLVVVAAACRATAGGDPAAGSQDLVVAAASDLRPAFELLGQRFEDEHDVEVVFDFGSSGQLAQRILEGAPFDVFASADAGFVDQVLDAGIGDRTTRATYAFGRIVLWADAAAWGGWTSLEELADDPDVTTIAIANPDHAPYGLAAEQALGTTGVLPDVADRLVFGENIADTQRLVETGNADVGVIALSLAIAADERGVGEWVLLDEGLHDPLQQDLVVTKTDGDRAELGRSFITLVDSERGREVMRRYGFLLPGDEGGGT
jgi:molybdate transport system substrate-binding protein